MKTTIFIIITILVIFLICEICITSKNNKDYHYRFINLKIGDEVNFMNKRAKIRAIEINHKNWMHSLIYIEIEKSRRVLAFSPITFFNNVK